MKIYGIVLFCWSLAVLVLSVFGWSWGDTSTESTALIFVLTAIGICPALATYTNCGLNSDPSIFSSVNEVDKAAKQNHQIMRRHFKYWNAILYAFYGLVITSFLIGLLVPGTINPFLFFVAAVGIFASTWAIIAYPAALKLLVLERPEDPSS